MSIEVKNLDAFRANVKRAPSLALSYIGKATEAAIFEVEKESKDSNFQFKTPRAFRTGDLEKSFKFGRFIHPSKLSASIGPTVHYAPSVYFGRGRRGKPNFFMDRIARAAEPKVVQHFERAIDLFITDISK